MNQTLSLMHLLGDTTQLVANSLYSGYIPKKKQSEHHLQFHLAANMSL